jgi:hypothetical protein
MLWWQNERKADYERIAKFVMPAGYVAGRMAGLDAGEAFIDYTFLHFTGCSDARSGTWSGELCDALGFDAARLTRIVDPWTVAGELTAEAARDFGLPGGIPIAAGCGDTAAGALGSGVVRSGMLLDTATEQLKAAKYAKAAAAAIETLATAAAALKEKDPNAFADRSKFADSDKAFIDAYAEAALKHIGNDDFGAAEKKLLPLGVLH